jgi:hypothetical protein
MAVAAILKWRSRRQGSVSGADDTSSRSFKRHFAQSPMFHIEMVMASSREVEWASSSSRSRAQERCAKFAFVSKNDRSKAERAWKQFIRLHLGKQNPFVLAQIDCRAFCTERQFWKALLAE